MTFVCIIFCMHMRILFQWCSFVVIMILVNLLKDKDKGKQRIVKASPFHDKGQMEVSQ